MKPGQNYKTKKIYQVSVNGVKKDLTKTQIDDYKGMGRKISGFSKALKKSKN